MTQEQFMLGNEAIALGLLEAGCQVLTSYPGTPSSEILPETVKLVQAHRLETYAQWSTNEKVALDNAFAAAVAGKRAACCMKQVGLNVAADSLLSAAYIGIMGALVIISCDDPGPHSSQTEQDTRLMARLAKVPVLDPANPQEAREMARLAMQLSERYQVPVILRPGIRVCHARQNIGFGALKSVPQKASFGKDPARWAATPKFRLELHGRLNEKLDQISAHFDTLAHHNFHTLAPGRSYPLGIIAGGVPYAVVRDLLDEQKRSDVPVLKLGAPYPFPRKLADSFTAACDKVVVLEETDTLIEYLLGDREKTLGRLSGHVPRQGELVPEVIGAGLNKAFESAGLPPLTQQQDPQVQALTAGLDLAVRRPTLCPGCPHRASFYALRKGRAKTIFTSDIGCYTLGINLGGVDTCLDMGAAITMASGFYHAFAQDQVHQPIIATLGDSTFYHSGTAGLLDAVYNGARFVLVILDNEITAMTGMQPTPGLGLRADGSRGKPIPLERVVKGCGVDYLEVVDPYDIKAMQKSVKKAVAYTQTPDGGIAVIIARHPCVIAYRDRAIAVKRKVTVTEDCVACGHCRDRFECPALGIDEQSGRTGIDRQICADCGLCIQVCPKKAIVEVEQA